MNSRGVAGFTYNFRNPTTQVQSGIDFLHFDWARRNLSPSSSLSDWSALPVSSFNDTGPHPIQTGFRSRVLGVGPQIGYIFTIGTAPWLEHLVAVCDFCRLRLKAPSRQPGAW